MIGHALSAQPPPETFGERRLRVLVADPDGLARSMLRTALQELERIASVAVAGDAIPLTVERVFARPGSEDHFWVVEEIAIDCDVDAVNGMRSDAKPLRIDVPGRLSRRPLAKKQDVGDD